MELEGISARTLSEADKNFMFRGLSTLIDYLFVHAARDIKVINTAGVNKIRRSILSLQQTLRDIITTDEESMLLRANEFWGLYELGPKVG
jgi:exocyst complex component 4